MYSTLRRALHYALGTKGIVLAVETPNRSITLSLIQRSRGVFRDAVGAYVHYGMSGDINLLSGVLTSCTGDCCSRRPSRKHTVVSRAEGVCIRGTYDMTGYRLGASCRLGCLADTSAYLSQSMLWLQVRRWGLGTIPHPRSRYEKTPRFCHKRRREK
jgi:hypothetical protein